MRLDKLHARSAGLTERDRQYKRQYTHRFSQYYAEQNLRRMKAGKRGIA